MYLWFNICPQIFLNPDRFSGKSTQKVRFLDINFLSDVFIIAMPKPFGRLPKRYNATLPTTYCIWKLTKRISNATCVQENHTTTAQL